MDQNLSDQAEQMEKALTAPSAEDSWRLWIQAIVRAGKSFFSHTKALHTTEETRQANRERCALLRNRQALRQRLGETAPQVDSQVKEVWTALRFRIRELRRKLRAAARRAEVQAEENMLRELQEAAQLGAKAKIHRLCVQLARNGRGVKGRLYTHVAAASPSLGESKKWLESPAEEGGMSAKILEDYDSEVRKVLSCFEPSAPADLNRETAARNGLRDTQRIPKRGPRRKSCPEWSAPAELLIMALDPRYYAVLTQARNTLLKVLVQVRCADGGNGATPHLAHLSRGVTLDKGNKKSGVKEGTTTDSHVLHMVESFFRCSFASQFA